MLEILKKDTDNLFYVVCQIGILQEIYSKLQKLIIDAVASYKSDSIALSGGLDSSILAFCLNDKKTKAIVTIAKDFPSSDLVFSQLVAKQIGIELDVKTASVDDLLAAVEETIKILKVFNPIEIRNSVVMYLTVVMAKEKGYANIITGDGADELFAGYRFFQKMSNIELQKDLERIWKVMHFPAIKIGKSLGISVNAPFLYEPVAEYAKSIPAELKVREENGKKYGKWILRKTFETRLPDSIIWREKSAMQDGSGTASLTSFFDNIISDSIFEDKKQDYLETEKARLGSKESLYYYEIYRKHNNPPGSSGTSNTRCPQCQAVVDKDAHFCRMCGSFPI